MKASVLAFACLAAAAGPAAAASIAPLTAPLGDAQASLGGTADAVAIIPDAGATSATGALRFDPTLERDYDSGLVLAFKATVLAYHDRLSARRYGGDALEKFVGEVQSGLGRLDIGETDGAAYSLRVAGPKVDDAISLDDPDLLLFRDPATGHAFRPLPLSAAVASSSNYAKIVYTSPTLFGVTLALSFAPSQGRELLPFVHEGPDVADRQADIWETALRYSDDFGPVTLSAYGGLAEGHDERRTAGHEGASDLGFGAQADYHASDNLTLLLGGGFRQTNEYNFDIDDALAAGTSRGTSASASADYDSWVAGIEYGDGVADAGPGVPRLALNGYQLSLGYDLTENLRLTGGWQRQNYARGSGLFYNGAPRIGVDAGFLHLDFHV